MCKTLRNLLIFWQPVRAWNPLSKCGNSRVFFPSKSDDFCALFPQKTFAPCCKGIFFDAPKEKKEKKTPVVMPKKQFKSLSTVPIFIQSRWDSSNDGPRQWRKFGEMFVHFSNSVMGETHMKFLGKSWGWQSDLRSLYSLKWVRYAPLGSPCKMHPEYIYIWIQWGVEIPKFGWKHETIYVELIPNSLPLINMKTVSLWSLAAICFNF